MVKILIPGAVLLASSLCCFIAYTYDVQLVFWLGLTASLIVAALGIVSTHREHDLILIVVAFSIAMCIPSFFQTKSWGFAYPMVDSAFDQTLSNLIRESGRWTPGVNFGILQGYSYYPILHIWTAAASDVAGFDTVVLARIFPFLVAPLVTVFFYLSLRKILSIEVAVWASLMYNLDGYWHFWEYFIREFISLVFFSMCLYAIFRMYKMREGRRSFAALGLIAVFMTVSSHHWTSYNLMLVLAVLTVFPTVYQHLHSWFMRVGSRTRLVSVQREKLVSRTFLLFTLAMIFFWISFIGYSLFTIHAQEFLDFLRNLVMPSFSHFVSHNAPGLSFTSRVLLYSGYLVLGLLGVAELVRQFPKKQKTYVDSVFESWFIFSAIYLIVATFLLPSSYQGISWRSWTFAFFGLTPLAAKSVVRMTQWKPKFGTAIRLRLPIGLRLLVPIILILPLFSAILVSSPDIRIPGYPSVGDSFYSSAIWIKGHLQNSTIALDPWARSVIVPYGMANEYPGMDSPDGSARFLDAVYRTANSTEVQSYVWQTIVFDRGLWQWEPNASSDSSSLDAKYNSIYDSGSLDIYVRPSS